MRAIVDTISSIDESSKKILFKHFDQSNVNILTNKAPILINNLTKIANDAQNNQISTDINSEDMLSDDSGNQSENDMINKVESKRIKLRRQQQEQQDSYDDSQNGAEDEANQVDDYLPDQEPQSNLIGQDEEDLWVDEKERYPLNKKKSPK